MRYLLAWWQNQQANSREQLFVINLNNIAHVANKINRSLGDIELFDLSIEVISDVQFCKDDLSVIVHLFVETIASLGANFYVVGANKKNCHFLFPPLLLYTLNHTLATTLVLLLFSTTTHYLYYKPYTRLYLLMLLFYPSTDYPYYKVYTTL